MTAPPPKSPAPAGAPAPAPKPASPPLGREKPSTLFWTVLMKRPDPLTSIAFTVPLFLFYHLGILLIDRRSPVDFISTLVFGVVETSRPAYVLMTLALTLMLLLAVWVQQKRIARPTSSFGRVMLESLGFGLLALTAFGWGTHEVRTGEIGALSLLSVGEKLLVAAGSGFHEEFIFRALLVTGGAWLLHKLGKVRKRFALVIAMLVSSVVYSFAHYFVIFDEPFYWNVACFRVLEGVFFASLYVFRGFAVAVYAHALYDLLSFFVYSP